MKPSEKAKDDKVTFAKPKDGESREEFTKRVIKQLRERGLLSKDNTNKESSPKQWNIK